MPRDIDPPGLRAVVTRFSDGSNDSLPPLQPHLAVIQTYPQAERWAVANLERRGYRCYLPMHALTVRDRVVRSMRRTVERPLFPGYCFVFVSGPWTPIRYCPGVAKLLMTAGKPNVVRAGVLEALQAGEAARRYVTPPEGLWRPGAACRLVLGPFQGQDAVVVAVGKRQVLVAFPVLGALREVRVQLDAVGVRDAE